MRHAARAPPPPILELGVLGHAFVVVTGILQNAKLRQCNFAVEFSEGSRQFLIVRCGCSPSRDLQTSIPKVSKMHEQWGPKSMKNGLEIRAESSKMMPWSPRGASWGASCFQSAPGTHQGARIFEKLVSFWRHLGNCWCNCGSQQIPKGDQKSHFFTKGNHKWQKNEVQEGIPKKHDL